MPESVTVIVEDQKLLADARTFKTGSRGYWAGGKLVIGGRRYQASVSLVEIGSKPGARGAAPAPVAKAAK